MCGRYELEAIKKDLWERYMIMEEESKDAFVPRKEVFPTNLCPVVIPGPDLAELKWGFMESFTKRPLINARAETILQKPTFREPFVKARCLVPATAFFEWEEVDGKKERRRIAIKGLPIFSLAGIRKGYLQEDGTTLMTFSIITTNATEEFANIHDRMPVILSPDQEEIYLDHDQPAELIQELLVPTSMSLIVE